MGERELEHQADALLAAACADGMARRRLEYPWLFQDQTDRRWHIEVSLNEEIGLRCDSPEAAVLDRVQAEEARGVVEREYRHAGLTEGERLCCLLPLYDLADREIAFILGVSRQMVFLRRRQAEEKLARTSGTGVSTSSSAS